MNLNQARELDDRIDVALLERSLDNADLPEIPDGKCLAVRNERGAVVAAEASGRIQAEQTENPHSLAALTYRSVRGNGEAAAVRIDLQWRAAVVEHGMAGHRRHPAGWIDLKSPVARVGDSARRIDREPTVSAHGDVEGIRRSMDRAANQGNVIAVRRRKRDVPARGRRQNRVEFQPFAEKARRARIGEIVREAVDSLRQSELRSGIDMQRGGQGASPSRAISRPKETCVTRIARDLPLKRQFHARLSGHRERGEQSRRGQLNFAIGLVVALGSILGGFAALGGHLIVIWQPWEFVIIGGSAFGTFIIANTMKTIRDTGAAVMEAILDRQPKARDYLDVLGILAGLMRELRTKSRAEAEKHVDNPAESSIFLGFPKVLANRELTSFICDYCRLIIIGNARTHEIEALMDEELHTIAKDQLKPYNALSAVSEALPALGIVAAVLGVIKAMGALDQSPELLGGLIGAALVGTFAGIFISYGIVTPLGAKIKGTREKQLRVYVIVKQSLLAFMNGALPQIAVEHGRKTIPSNERPSIDDVELEVSAGSARSADAA